MCTVLRGSWPHHIYPLSFKQRTFGVVWQILEFAALVADLDSMLDTTFTVLCTGWVYSMVFWVESKQTCSHS